MKSAMTERKQFIVDASGKPVGVLLDFSTYERLREAAEDKADLRAYRAAKTRVAAQIARGDYVTAEEYRNKNSRKAK